MPRCPSGFTSEATSSWKPSLTTLCTWRVRGSLLCAPTGCFLPGIYTQDYNPLPVRSLRMETTCPCPRVLWGRRKHVWVCLSHPSAPRSPGHVSLHTQGTQHRGAIMAFSPHGKDSGPSAPFPRFLPPRPLLGAPRGVGSWGRGSSKKDEHPK